MLHNVNDEVEGPPLWDDLEGLEQNNSRQRPLQPL